MDVREKKIPAMIWGYIRRSSMFDAEWYKEKYGGDGFDGMSPEEHYYYIGWKKGYNPSMFFDTDYYIKKYRDVADTKECPLLHYVLYGMSEGRIPSSRYVEEASIIANSYLFDAEWYVETYDIKVDGMTPAEHFCCIGWERKYNPSPYFDTNFYLSKYPDIAKDKINPLVHFILCGNKEGRVPTVVLECDVPMIEKSAFFDADWYVKAYDIVAEDMTPAEHFCYVGWKKKYNPSPYFDTNFYLSKYPDVATQKINPLVHFISYGNKEGRAPTIILEHDVPIIEKSAIFDAEWYVNTYNVVVEDMTPAEHFCYIGWKKKYNPSLYFDTNFYISKYPDVVAKKINPLTHFINKGDREGRNPTKWFDRKSCVFRQNSLVEFIQHVNSYFDEEFYKECYNITNNPLLHYIHYGYKRYICSPKEIECVEIEKRRRILNGMYFYLSEKYKKHFFEAEKYKKSILILSSAMPSDGTYIWRCQFLKELCMNSGIQNVHIESIQVPSIDFYKRLYSCSLIIYSRPTMLSGSLMDRKVFGEIVRLNKPLIIDIDDLYNPEYAVEFGSVKSGIIPSDRIEEHILSTSQTFQYASFLMVSTEKIANSLKKYNKNIIVRGNAISDQYIQEKIKVKQDIKSSLKLIIASGSDTHDFDLSRIYLDLTNFLLKHLDVEITIVGKSNVDFSFMGLKNRYNRIGALSYSNMIKEFSEHDCLIVPLDKNEFNHAKSNIKFIEAAAAGIPVLAGNCSEFRIIKNRYNGYLYDDDFLEQIEYIYAHRNELPIVAERASKLVKDSFSTKTKNDELISLLKKYGD